MIPHPGKHHHAILVEIGSKYSDKLEDIKKLMFLCYFIVITLFEEGNCYSSCKGTLIGHFRVLPFQCLFCGLVTLTSICLGIIIFGLSSFISVKKYNFLYKKYFTSMQGDFCKTGAFPALFIGNII